MASSPGAGRVLLDDATGPWVRRAEGGRVATAPLVKDASGGSCQ